MATRKERVVLELEDRFSTELARAAAVARVFDRELDGINSRTAPAFTRTAVSIERDASKVGNSIDRLSGRLSILAQSGAALGPALVPAAAAAVPAIAGLTTQLGFGVAAAGTAVLAFNGFSEALETMNAAALDPTAKSLEKAREAMEKLSPAAQEMVLKVRDMAPAFRDVRDAASEGLFPGLIDGLDEIETLLPRVSSIVGEIADATGDLIATGAESLAGPEWEAYFAFVESEARPAISRLGGTIGNLTKGLAEMWMAFDPLSDDFQDSLLSASKTFEEWAEGLSASEDFADFLAYVRETGPQVMDTLGSIADAFLQIAEAAAPLGGPVLKVLEAVADTIAAIADSDLGTPILTAVSALSAFNLLASATSKIGGTAFGGFIRGQAQASLGLKTLRTDLALMRAEYSRFGATQALLTSAMSNTTGAANRTRDSFALVGKGAAAGAAGVAALELGLMDSQAAMGALTGGLVGGAPGAVAGGLIGLTLELAGANDELSDSLEKSRRGLESLDFAQTYEGLDQARRDLDKFLADTDAEELKPHTILTRPMDHFKLLKSNVEGLFGDSDREEARAAWEKQAGDVEKAETAIAALARGFGQDITPLFAGARISTEDLIRTVELVGPAMTALKISVKDLGEMDDAELAAATERIRSFTLHMDSDAGRTDILADAFKGLGDEFLTTEERADNLRTSLENLLDPKMNLQRARDQWDQGLRDLNENLDTKIVTDRDGKEVEVPGSREVFGKTEGAATNRAELQAQIDMINTLVTATAEVDPELASRVFKNQYEALLDTAEAAGLARDEVKTFLTNMGLVPDAVVTEIQLKGIPGAEAALDRLARDRVVKITAKVNDLDAVINRHIRNPQGSQFWTGGYTGDGAKLEPAGVVHRGEFVFDQETTRKNRGLFEAIHNGMPGYVNGGYVASRAVPATAGVGVGIDLKQLAAEMAPHFAAMRPLYGDVHVNGDPTTFKQQMQQDAALAGLDGIRRP